MEQTYNDIENRSVSITGLLPAPVDIVWDAWNDPEQVAQWWGPAGFTNTILEMDVSPGGTWSLVMQGPDGKRYPNKSKFLEIIPFQKIVLQHFNPHYRATINFTPGEKETLIRWTMVFETAELYETVVKVFKADEGLQQNLEKLQAFLESNKRTTA